jgi:hypothetical protein
MRRGSARVSSSRRACLWRRRRLHGRFGICRRETRGRRVVLLFEDRCGYDRVEGMIMKCLCCPRRNVFDELKRRFDVHSYQPAHAQTTASPTAETTRLLASRTIFFGANTSHSLHKLIHRHQRDKNVSPSPALRAR